MTGRLGKPTVPDRETGLLSYLLTFLLSYFLTFLLSYLLTFKRYSPI